MLGPGETITLQANEGRTIASYGNPYTLEVN